MGLKRRVSIGFISIVGVLILSGMVSFFELNTLSRDTDKILETNARYSKLSESMIDALNQHSRVFVRMTAFNERRYDSLCLECITRLDSTLIVAKRESMVPEVLDSMMVIAAQLRSVSSEYLAAPQVDSLLRLHLSGGDGLNVDSLIYGIYDNYGRYMYEKYLPIHDKMLTSIEFYDNESDRALAPSAEQLHNNAYRAVTPILLSLLVMIVIVLMLYYFIMIYCVKPVIKINNALNGYLSYKIPFAPKASQRDELLELTDRIELLIKQSRINKEV